MVLVGKPEGKRQLGLPQHQWSGNIKMNLKEDVRPWTGFILHKVRTKDSCHKIFPSEDTSPEVCRTSRK
jgi:hypothetical protein